MNSLKSAPLFASVKLTDACNSKCITCSIDGVKKSSELSTRQVFHTLYQLHQCGIRFIRFTGGEPLLRRDLESCIEEAARLGFKRIYIATNGLLLEQKSTQLSKATNITVSVDGIGATNDHIRGVPGSFKKSINGIRKLKSDHPAIDIEIATTLLAANLGETEHLISVCRELEIQWFVNLFDTHLYFFQDIAGTQLEARETERIEAALASIRQAHAATPAAFSFGRRQIDTMAEYLLHGRFPRYCILGFTNVDIAPNGDVYSGCWAMVPMGNIHEESLHVILSSEDYRRRIKQMLLRKCPQCTCGWMVNSLYEQL
ncbi:MAG: radical SAM/SPASM domain-containing protein [Desulfopila sp.]